TWAWGRESSRPVLRAAHGDCHVEAVHPSLGTYWLAWHGAPLPLFTDNETNFQRLWGGTNATPYTRDGINSFVVDGCNDAVNPRQVGTKVALQDRFDVAGGATHTVLLRLSAERHRTPFGGGGDVFDARRAEADRFYAPLARGLDDQHRQVQRQAYAGLLWSKQVYVWDLSQWLSGDPAGPEPPAERRRGRNSGWLHFNTTHVLSVPDTWEYPWFAAWDLAFHCIPLAYVDPEFAEDQLTIMLRDWYMHPNGPIPADEW